MPAPSLRPGLFASAALVAALGAASGCSSSDGSTSAPAGVACATTSPASDAAGAKAALASAGQGACVVLAGGSYAGPLEVPAGVTLTAADGAHVAIDGGASADPAVTLGEGSVLVGVDVTAPSGVGVAVRAGSATVSRVTVHGAKTAALAVQCAGPTCASGTVSLDAAELTASGIGLWISGAHVAAKGGRVGDNASESLASGFGVVAQSGAKLEIDGTTVDKNGGVGVLVDGAGTTATIANATVSDNGERGVWVQRVAGTIDAPAVTVKDSTLVRNKIVGLGGVEARGIIIVGGRVAETVAAPVVTDLSSTEQVGDGVGIFGGSTDVKIDGTKLEANARAAGVVDGSDRGIIIVGGDVQAGPSGLKFVVQRSKADVQIAAGDTSTPSAPLGVSAPKLTVPAVLR